MNAARAGWAFSTALFIAAALITACGGKPVSEAPKPSTPAATAPMPTVTVVVVATGAARAVPFPAVVEASEVIDVVARIAGVVDAVLVREGDVVRAGDPLVQLDQRRLIAVADAASAAVARAQALFDDATEQWQRRQAAAETLSREALASARASLAIAEADLAARRAELRSRSLDVLDAVIRAPCAGVIDQRTCRPGQQVAAGTRVVGMVQRLPLYLRISMVEQDAAQIRRSASASAIMQSSGRTSSAVGSVVHVAQRADPTTRLADVLVRIDGDPGWLPGAFAQAFLMLADNPAPWVPLRLVRTSERGSSLRVVTASGAVAMVRDELVSLGSQDAQGFVQVTRGLKPGDLLVSGSDNVRPGMLVNVVTATGGMSAFSAAGNDRPRAVQ